MSSQPVPYPIRMSDELRDALAERARKGGRSLHAEIIGILHEAVTSRPIAGNSVDVDLLAEQVANRVIAKLKPE